MKRDSRLSITLHALVHMAESSRALTSEELAVQADCNPVVIRRTLAGLRKARIVVSEKGHGGGWRLLRPVDRITLGDVYDALGTPTIFAMGDRTESPGCLVEQAVNRAMRDAFGQAESLLVSQLRSVSVAEVLADARAYHRGSHKTENQHA
ncbi:MAG: Rrf2 family transcriptional regulator [Deltaproteobacteria bacterium]|nr:Rrf2 family transcriptional regulator [Deltaproteobacteria bacterium]